MRMVFGSLVAAATPIVCYLTYAYLPIFQGPPGALVLGTSGAIVAIFTLFWSAGTFDYDF